MAHSNSDAASAPSSRLSDVPTTPETLNNNHASNSDSKASEVIPQNGISNTTPQFDQGFVNSLPQVDGSPEDSSPERPKKIQKRLTMSSSRRPKQNKWSSSQVIQNSDSPLVHAPLKAVFANPEAFSSLTDEQKDSLLGMMRNEQDIMTGDDGKRSISQSFLRYDPDWQHFISRFQEDISEGRYDTDFLKQALSASQNRQEGKFDKHKEDEFENFWGQKQKLGGNVIAGDSSNINLDILFIHGILKAGDIWVFLRNIAGKGGADAILTEKEIAVTQVSSVGLPTVSIPPGQYKMPNPEREDIILSNIKGPGQVLRAVMDMDERVKNPPAGNGWKTIRVVRNNQDLGTLWDLRQAYHFSKQA